MGEIQRHHVTHHLSPELRDILKVMATPAQVLLAEMQPAPAPEATDPGPLVEHWTFHDPRQACDVVAYLDPQNQVRHVPASRTPDVPKTWRRLLLEVRE